MFEQRPLVVRCGAFGDMVLLTALTRILNGRFKSPVDILTSGPWSAPLLEGQPGIGEVFSLRSRKTPYWLAPEQRRVVEQLRSRGTGPTWYCDADQAALPLIERAGIPGDCIVNVKDHPLLPGEHATEQWRRLGRIMPASMGGAAPTAEPDVPAGCFLAVSERQSADLDGWLRTRELLNVPLILIQAGNKRTMRRGLRRLAANHKYWPNSRWAEVLRWLRARHPQHAIVLLGTGPEYALNREIEALAGIDRLHNAAHELPIPRLIALLGRGAGLVTVDSGPAHAAAAVGCPQVVLFGKALPSLYRPWGIAGADVKLLCGQVEGEPDMAGITTAAVIDACAALEWRAGH